ncbi:AbrB/MazE/SpoVT family DNA-binding domain-containing protein [Granulicella paludicola]|uniref:AbrB/MazE/SpoVT family DNA-binding domain-containing protein n=1 Tax=Granulicella paludicola TaxID=474951 RepID=UPI0037BF6043
MQVAKWGNSLAIRIPAALAEELDLKVGDDVQLEAHGSQKLGLRKDHTREHAIQTLRSLRRPFPPNYKFDRDEANER